MHPEEREYKKKMRDVRKFYAIDVRAGDIIRYDFEDSKYFGLVVEILETEDPGSKARMVSGKVQWSLEEPSNVENSWYNFDSNRWFVMNR